MTITLDAQQLSMRFKDRVLFHIDHLSIGPKDAIYLSGDNGVGKTTLLKILAGLQKPTRGTVSNSQPWWMRFLRSSARRNVIYLHQTPYLFDATVYENVLYGIKFSRSTAQEKRSVVINALRMVGLETLADEHISVLSGGEKQRVAMARAWILNPSILLMDEPSASLDQESIERLVVMAKDLLSRGSSIIITSHQKNALTELCKKQWWINDCTLTETPLLHIVKQEKENSYASSLSN